jgi:hypothetical protein
MRLRLRPARAGIACAKPFERGSSPRNEEILNECSAGMASFANNSIERWLVERRDAIAAGRSLLTGYAA